MTNYKFKQIILNKICLGNQQHFSFENEKAKARQEDENEKLKALGYTLFNFLWFQAASGNTEYSEGEC